MTQLHWHQDYPIQYETGTDRGVLYPISGAPGIAWNGLISVQETFDGGEVEEYYFDGIKYFNKVSVKDFRATITAFSIPLSLKPSLGEQAIHPGVYLTRQPRALFSLSYRTLIGPEDYKVHIVYNALASPQARNYTTMGDIPTPVNFQWDISAVPVQCGDYKPTAHFVLDSRIMDPDKLHAIERILYGEDGPNNRLDGGHPETIFAPGDVVDGNIFDGIVDGNDIGVGGGTVPYLPSICALHDLLSEIEVLV